MENQNRQDIQDLVNGNAFANGIEYAKARNAMLEPIIVYRLEEGSLTKRRLTAKVESNYQKAQVISQRQREIHPVLHKNHRDLYAHNVLYEKFMGMIKSSD